MTVSPATINANAQTFERGVTTGKAYAPNPYWLAGYWWGYWLGLIERGLK